MAMVSPPTLNNNMAILRSPRCEIFPWDCSGELFIRPPAKIELVPRYCTHKYKTIIPVRRFPPKSVPKAGSERFADHKAPFFNFLDKQYPIHFIPIVEIFHK